MFKKSIGLWLIIFLVCLGIAGCSKEKSSTRIEKSSTRVVAEKLIAQIDSFSWGVGSLMVSPDSKRVAYVAKVDDKWFVVVDGKKGKQYEDIVTEKGGKVIFDSPDSLHCLALKGDSIYLVEERIK